MQGLKLVRVLIVEADGAIRFLLGQVVAGHGYVPLSAGTGGTALALAELDPPRVVLVDEHLPDVRGSELIGRLRSAMGPRPGGVSILGISSTAEGCAELLASGADRVARKPMHASTLTRAIDRLVGVHRIARSARPHRSRRSTSCAACQPHMPCTPPPGGVEEEQR